MDYLDYILGFLIGAVTGIIEDAIAFRAARKQDPDATWNWTQTLRRALRNGAIGTGILPGFFK